jgi:very-short-patch-repair endonuclease
MPEHQERKELARELRRCQTDAEALLWARLRDRQLAGVKFRRQQPLGRYIVDFVSLEKRIVVEVDGSQHSEDKREERDNERTAWLQDEGYRVLRFWNNDVLQNTEGVLERIMDELR